jgi:hypothetical protein
MAVLRLGGGYDVNAIYAWIWTVRYSMLSRTYLLEPEAPRFAISDAAKTCSAIATLPIRLFTYTKKSAKSLRLSLRWISGTFHLSICRWWGKAV